MGIKEYTAVTREQAEEAVRTILRWIGEDITREGLLETPKRVIKSYAEHFKGYAQDPYDVLKVNFKEIDTYQDIIVLKNIRFESTCEHHMAPIVGLAHIAYIPNKGVVGISKLARIVDVFAKRLQIQERMTAQIANSIYEVLGAKGVAVVIDAEHHCMTTRGVHNTSAIMRTQSFTGTMMLGDGATDSFLRSIVNS